MLTDNTKTAKLIGTHLLLKCGLFREFHLVCLLPQFEVLWAWVSNAHTSQVVLANGFIVCPRGTGIICGQRKEVAHPTRLHIDVQTGGDESGPPFS